eukprot:1269123-Amphidinium_carterae.1
MWTLWLRGFRPRLALLVRQIVAEPWVSPWMSHGGLSKPVALNALAAAKAPCLASPHRPLRYGVSDLVESP